MRNWRRASKSTTHHNGDTTKHSHGNGHAQPHPHYRRKRPRGTRHRAAVQGILMGAMIFSAQPKPKAMQRAKEALPVAEVTVSMDSFTVLPPSLAYEDIIEEAAKLHGIDRELIRAVIQTESGFNAKAESPVGAQGLMQLMPALQEDLGVDDPFDPRQNIMAGALYLKKLLDKHDGDIALTLASYNAGPGNVAKYRGIPPFQETRNYVKKITALLADTADIAAE